MYYLLEPLSIKKITNKKFPLKISTKNTLDSSTKFEEACCQGFHWKSRDIVRGSLDRGCVYWLNKQDLISKLQSEQWLSAHVWQRQSYLQFHQGCVVKLFSPQTKSMILLQVYFSQLSKVSASSAKKRGKKTMAFSSIFTLCLFEEASNKKK